MNDDDRIEFRVWLSRETVDALATQAGCFADGLEPQLAKIVEAASKLGLGSVALRRGMLDNLVQRSQRRQAGRQALRGSGSD